MLAAAQKPLCKQKQILPRSLPNSMLLVQTLTPKMPSTSFINACKSTLETGLPLSIYASTVLYPVKAGGQGLEDGKVLMATAVQQAASTRFRTLVWSMPWWRALLRVLYDLFPPSDVLKT